MLDGCTGYPDNPTFFLSIIRPDTEYGKPDIWPKIQLVLYKQKLKYAFTGNSKCAAVHCCLLRRTKSEFVKSVKMFVSPNNNLLAIKKIAGYTVWPYPISGFRISQISGKISTYGYPVHV